MTRNIKGSLIVLVIFFVFTQCEMHDRVLKYEIYNKAHDEYQLSGFLRIHLTYHDEYSWSEKRIYYTKDLLPRDTLSRIYKRDNKAILIRNPDGMFVEYATIRSKNCTINGLDDNSPFETKICFLGKENILVDGVLYNNSIVFSKYTGVSHVTKSALYLDENFMLLKEEYLSGPSIPYMIIREGVTK